MTFPQSLFAAFRHWHRDTFGFEEGMSFFAFAAVAVAAMAFAFCAHLSPLSSSDSIKLGTVRTIGRPINRWASGERRATVRSSLWTWRSGTPREQIKEGGKEGGEEEESGLERGLKSDYWT